MLLEVFLKLKKEIMEKMETIVIDVEPHFLMDKPPKQIKPDDFKTLEVLWSACTMEDASRAGESQSEAKTIDVIELNEEGGVRSKAISLINLLFERWQDARKEVNSFIEKGASKGNQLQDESALTEDIKSLFWGKEVFFY